MRGNKQQAGVIGKMFTNGFGAFPVPIEWSMRRQPTGTRSWFKVMECRQRPRVGWCLKGKEGTWSSTAKAWGAERVNQVTPEVEVSASLNPPSDHRLPSSHLTYSTASTLSITQPRCDFPPSDYNFPCSHCSRAILSLLTQLGSMAPYIHLQTPPSAPLSTVLKQRP